MGDDRDNRRLSLKELFAVVTWVAVALAGIRLGKAFENEGILAIGLVLLAVGRSMTAIGVGCALGFFFGGRQAARTGGLIACFLF